MITRHQQRQVATFGRYAQASAEDLHLLDAAQFVAEMARQDVSGGQRLAEIVGQCGKAAGQRQPVGSRLVDDHQGVDTGIDFRVVVGPLRHAEERIDLRQKAGERPAVAKHLDHP